MLNLKEKIEIFKTILDREEQSYADSFNAEILLFSENFDFNFLEKLDLQLDIENWIKKLKSRIVLNEDKDLTEEIINNYIICG